MKKIHIILSLIFGLFLSISLFSIILITSLPFNALKTQVASSSAKALVPQGWVFFTRNPREAQTYFYKRENNKWRPVTSHYSAPSNFFGISRKNRAFNARSAHISMSIKPNSFLDCKNSIENCIANFDKTKIDTLKYLPIFGNIHGDLVLEVSTPTPWAWKKSFNKKKPIKIARIFIP